MPHTQRCAICGRELSPRAENRFHPFCSERCKLIDLGQWLGGAYRIPDRPAGEEELGEEGQRAPGEDDAGTVH